WLSLSPSYLPAKVLRSRPSSLALACAPSRILTKKGLPSVLVIRPTMSAAHTGVAAITPKATAPATASFVNVNLLILILPVDMWSGHMDIPPAGAASRHPARFHDRIGIKQIPAPDTC